MFFLIFTKMKFPTYFNIFQNLNIKVLTGQIGYLTVELTSQMGYLTVNPIFNITIHNLPR